MTCASSRAPKRTVSSRYSRTTRRRRVDGVHHVVERPGQLVDVFAINRRDERAVEALDDLVGQEVALVLDFLDLVGLVPDRLVGREHLFEQARALLQLVGHARGSRRRTFLLAESGGKPIEIPQTTDARRATASQSLRIVADSFTPTLHADRAPVYHSCRPDGASQRSSRARARRRTRLAALPADAASLEAGGADCRQVPPHRHPDQQLPARRHPADLRPDAVQLGVAQPAHRPDLPDGSLQPGIRRDPGGRADARQLRTGSRARPTPSARPRGTSRGTRPTTTSSSPAITSTGWTTPRSSTRTSIGRPTSRSPRSR